MPGAQRSALGSTQAVGLMLHNQTIPPCALSPESRVYNDGRVRSCSYSAHVAFDLSNVRTSPNDGPYGESSDPARSGPANTKVRLRHRLQFQFVLVRPPSQECKRISPPQVLFRYRYDRFPGKRSDSGCLLGLLTWSPFRSIVACIAYTSTSSCQRLGSSRICLPFHNPPTKEKRNSRKGQQTKLRSPSLTSLARNLRPS